jgi:hypothetical protein
VRALSFLPVPGLLIITVGLPFDRNPCRGKKIYVLFPQSPISVFGDELIAHQISFHTDRYFIEICTKGMCEFNNDDQRGTARLQAFHQGLSNISLPELELRKMAVQISICVVFILCVQTGMHLPRPVHQQSDYPA